MVVKVLVDVNFLVRKLVEFFKLVEVEEAKFEMLDVLVEGACEEEDVVEAELGNVEVGIKVTGVVGSVTVAVADAPVNLAVVAVLE